MATSVQSIDVAFIQLKYKLYNGENTKMSNISLLEILVPFSIQYSNTLILSSSYIVAIC